MHMCFFFSSSIFLVVKYFLFVLPFFSLSCSQSFFYCNRNCWLWEFYSNFFLLQSFHVVISPCCCYCGSSTSHVCFVLCRYLLLKFDSIRFQSQKTKSPSFVSSFIKLFLHFRAKTSLLSQLYLFFVCVFCFSQQFKFVLFCSDEKNALQRLQHSHCARWTMFCADFECSTTRTTKIAAFKVLELSSVHIEYEKRVSNGIWVFIDS